MSNYNYREDKTMRTFLKMIVAIIVATAVAMVMIANGMNGKAVVCAYFGVGIMMSAILGVFGSADKQARKYRTKYGSIRHRMGYRKVA